MPKFRTIPVSNIIIGDYVTIGMNVTFDIAESGKLFVGDHVSLNQYTILSSASGIHIGNWTGISEHSSVRDNNHNIRKGELYKLQEISTSPVFIGNNVWVGTGCYILKGSKIPDGCVIGANSIVNAKCEMETDCIYAGNPVSFIRKKD